MPAKPGEVFQFGEFVLNPAQRSLRRDGDPIVLTTKAFDLLLFMVENPGRLLTREEILHAVWPDTVVEEGNLSQSISLVRKALGEKAGEQHYVLTVFGSGYQFGARVTRVSAAGESSAGRPVEDMQEALRGLRSGTSGDALERSGPLLVTSPAALPRSGPRAEDPRPALVMPSPRGKRKHALLAAATAALAIAVTGVAWLHWRAVPAANIHVLLGELDNSTGDATFDHALNKALQIDLQQSPSLVLLSEGRIRNTLKQMQFGPADKVTPEVAREACQRLNGQAVLEPMIASFGGHYLLTLTARACSDGRTLGDRKQEATDKAGILAALDKLADGIRHDIGESRASIYRYDKPLLEGETSSLEALKAYSEGGRLINAGKLQEAIAMYQRALDLDPKFAIAYADLSSVYYNLGDRQRDRDNITRAYQLRNSTNDRYRYYIEYRYHMSVTGDLTKATQTLEQEALVYPHDGAIRSNLCNLENWIGNYPRAVQYADESMAIDHADNIYNAIGFEIAARAYKHANQLDRAQRLADETVPKGPSQGMLGVMLQMAAMRHDDAAVEKIIAMSRGTANEPHVLQEAGAAALYAGKAKLSQDLYRQAHDAARRENAGDDLLDLDATQARMLAEVGLRDQAVAALGALPKMDDAMDAVYAMATVGDPAKAEAIAKDRVQADPTDELLNVEYAPAVHAAVALRNGHPQQAIQFMAADAPFELRDPTVPYLLGQAYLAAGQPQQALAEFRKFLDNPGIDDPLTPLYALSVLGTARAQVMLGQPGAAIASYQAFLDRWKDADSDLPVLGQARTEMAALQSRPH
jgi:DNA-binding winged helix-turn-helix (wHTH) protein/tetratricopeptide (TPR) repeat protein